MQKTANELEWVLYQRDDCHLCVLAVAELAAVRFPEFASVFIDDDTALEDLWGSSVPVLQHVSSGALLRWPFGVASLRDFLEAHAA